MNLIAPKEHMQNMLDIDSLLQDSYLLVVELRHGTPVHSSRDLSVLCVNQIEHVRQSLKGAGMSQRSIDHISHAQCALLDETVLCCAKDDVRTDWISEPLQAKFFNRHQAGKFLYEELREVLREPAPDVHVLTVFQRVLMLGFLGRYREVNEPERVQLLAALSAHVPPLTLNQPIPTQIDLNPRSATLSWLQSPLAQVLAAILLLGASWWGLDHALDGLITSLVPGQV
jgi:type VI secretion system protein ImpK